MRLLIYCFIRYVEMFDQHYEDKQMDALVIDVSRFHMINERYGRQYGDDILRKIGTQIRQLARKIGSVGCRSGAHTFYIYCPSSDDHEELFDKISSALNKNENDSDRIRLRMGVYADVDKSLDIELRFERAKRAADTIKNSYRKQIALYDTEMREKAMFRERLLEEFRPSLTDGQFKVYFQPKFDIRPDAPVLYGAEALVRWEHPELGIPEPDSFIQLFEENGLILEIGRASCRERV